ncbi:unnamed protein product [Rotaria sordida]|uniref:Uncharacterized protein n=3 Tax=Rotaria sordida TaxID=392033 RepID=A0A815KQC6_9BILA|nr:unnamed protein product [Rotaria sordida]
MVSQGWIDYYNNFKLYFIISNRDFRANAGHQFQILATLCEQAQQTVNSALQVFLQRQFVSSQIISQELFRSQINESIEEWKSNTLNSFLHLTQLIRVTNQGNQLINSFHNFYFYLDQISGQLIPVPANYSTCSCARSSTCQIPMGIFVYNWTIFDYVELFHIPNFFTGCFLVESLLESTLECFYDHQCMKIIESYTSNTTTNFSLLDTTRNSPNETVQSIINRLMIDAWQSNISFSAYYKMCSPLSCTYEQTRRHDIVYLISSIFGLFAGLLFGIEILILIILRFIEKMVNDFSLIELKRTFKNVFICRNEQQIINRCHFILLIATICLLYLATSLTLVSKTERVIRPSLFTYQYLLTNYQDSLQCSCSDISIEYQSFLTITSRIHQICSSDFVSNDWIDYIYNTIDPFHLNYTDFRTTAIGQYQLLASFCQLSRQVLNDALSNLLTSHFIDTELLSYNVLYERIQSSLKEFQMAIPNSFLNSLSVIRETTGTNMLMNMFMTSSEFQYESLVTIFSICYTRPLSYEKCNCGLSSKCVQSSRGMMAGCYPLEALLQSTFQCFYNQTCINSHNIFQALNISSSTSSQFFINSSIESILNKLMVEDYSINISYENYFSQCEPLLCSYSYSGHLDILAMTSNIIGIYGGLVIIARFIVVFFFKLYLNKNQKVSPQESET